METTDQAVLSFDPFQGDFEGGHVLKNHMVVAAKEHEDCHICAGIIAKGERHRHLVERFEGELEQFRWCALCCEAMALYGTDDGAAMDAREALRYRITDKT